MPIYQALPILKALDCVLVKSSLDSMIGQLVFKQLDICLDEVGS
jgi:hypothetical protein